MTLIRVVKRCSTPNLWCNQNKMSPMFVIQIARLRLYVGNTLELRFSIDDICSRIKRIRIKRIIYGERVQRFIAFDLPVSYIASRFTVK